MKLTSFTAALKGTQVNTAWSVTNEENFKGYELQSCHDGVSFKTITYLPGKQAGQYAAVDRHPYKGSNYYRLKMTDLDGKYTYSKTIQVNFDINALADIFPNPATGGMFQLTLKSDIVSKPATLLLLNAGGQVILQQTFSKLAKTEQVDISRLSPGTYFIRLTVNDVVIMKTLQVMTR